MAIPPETPWYTDVMKRSVTNTNHKHEDALLDKIYLACLILQIILIALAAVYPQKALFIAGFLLFTFCISAFHFARLAHRVGLNPLPRFFFPHTRHEALSLAAYLITALLHGALYTILLYPDAFNS
jgi:hypothetical protein